MDYILFDDIYNVSTSKIRSILREISSEDELSLGESLFFILENENIKYLQKFSEQNLTSFGINKFTELASKQLQEGGIQFSETSKVFLSLYPIDVFSRPRAFIGLIVEKEKLSDNIKDILFKEKFYIALKSIIKYNLEYIKADIQKELQRKELSQKLSEEGNLSKTLEKKLSEKIFQITNLKDKLMIKDSILTNAMSEMQDILKEFNKLSVQYNEVNRESLIAITNLENKVHESNQKYNILQEKNMKIENQCRLISAINNTISQGFALINKDRKIEYYSEGLQKITKSKRLDGVHCYIAIGRRTKCPNCQLESIISEKLDSISIDSFSSLLNSRLDIVQKPLRLGTGLSSYIIDIFDFDIDKEDNTVEELKKEIKKRDRIIQSLKSKVQK